MEQIKRVAIALSMAACSFVSRGQSYPHELPGAELHHGAVSVRLGNDMLQFARRNVGQILVTKFGVDAQGYTKIELPDTNGSYLRVKASELANHIDFFMESPSFTSTGGLRLKIDNYTVDLHLGLEGSMADIFGADPQYFYCNGNGTVEIKHIDLLMEPNVVRNAQAKPRIVGTTTAQALEIGSIALSAGNITPAPPVCLDAHGTNLCTAQCRQADIAMRGISEGVGMLEPLLNAVFPTLASVIGNALLSLLWGEELEVDVGIPVPILPWIDDGIGRTLFMVAAAEDGALDVNQLGAGKNDLSLGMVLPFGMGMYSDPSPCVTPSSIPVVDRSVKPPPLDGYFKYTDPKTGEVTDEPYHVGMMLSDAYLNTVTYAMRNSGMFCAAVGSNPGGILSSGSFVPTAGLLYLMANELQKLAPPDAPIFFRTIPTETPTISFGSGKETLVDANGKPMREPLITAHMPAVRIEFDLLAWQRYVRAFSMTVDLSVGMSIISTIDGRMTLSIDQLSVENLREVNNPISIRSDEFANLAQVIFGLVTNVLAGGRLTFDLPLNAALQEALGTSLRARILDIRPEGDAGQFLGAYFKMCSVNENNPSDKGCYIPPAPAREDEAPLEVTPLSVTGDMATFELKHAPGWEYQIAVDSDVYGRFSTPNGTIFRAQNPLFRLLGDHQVSIRSKRVGEPLDTARPVKSVTVSVEKPVQTTEATLGVTGKRTGCAQTTESTQALLTLALIALARATSASQSLRRRIHGRRGSF